MTAVAIRRRIRTTVKELVSGVIRAIGLGVLARLTWTRRAVAIVVYHDPSPARLDKHLAYLRSRYALIDVECLVSALARGEWGPVPRNAVLVTLDDGCAGNVELVPVFERYGVRPVIYVCPGVIEGDGRFWFKTPGVDPEPLKLVDSATRAVVVEAAQREAAQGSGGAPERRDAVRREDLGLLSSIADIGSHTMTHPILPLCTATEARREIFASRERITDLTGLPCVHFSYPNGDYSDRDVDLVRLAGYTTARTTDAGWNRPGVDPFRLRLTSPADHCSVNALAADLVGLFYLRRRGKDAARRCLLSTLRDDSPR